MPFNAFLSTGRLPGQWQVKQHAALCVFAALNPLVAAR